jgi:aspartyl-tRNA(Asn)/glutamyl-tRNA(Gln) amidotransferase subunit A
VNDADLLELIDDPARRREAGAVEVVEALLARIEERNPALNAFLAVTAELALVDARRVDERRACGADPGPLDGMPVAIKDNIDVAGVTATAGAAIFRDRIPDRDAETVRRLRAAGAVVIGKTALHELAYGATTNNPHFGPCRNPWDTSRIPGGSSGGSGAALGADLCIGALGTDTGGSVRVPAAFNGISALRPTYGSVSCRGVLSLCPSLDTVGPMARAIGDVARLAAVIAGYDREDPYAVEPPRREPLPPADGSLRGLRVGLPVPFFFDEPVEPAVAANARAAAGVLAELGASVSEIEIEGAERAMADCATVIRAEALAEHRERFENDPGSIGEDVRRRLALGLEVSGVELAEAFGRMRRWRARMLAAFDAVDVLLSAATPAPAPPIESAETIATSAQVTRLCYPWSLAGLPAVALPCGLDDGGLPTGLQLAAAPWRDDLALRAGAAYQRVTAFHRLRPPAPVGAR